MTTFLAAGGFLWGSFFSNNWINHANAPVFHGILLFVAILVFSLIYRLSLKAIEDEVVPAKGISIKNLFQSLVEALVNMVRSVIPHHADSYFPIIGAIFIYFLFANLMGLIPGFGSPSSNLSGNLAVGAIVFFYYNFVGIRQVGFSKYIKHFFAPGLGKGFVALFFQILLTIGLILPIELISHVVRPIVLAFRLFVNINGDHLVLGAFSDLVPLLVPVIFMAFGIFVAFVQSFVFALLSTVYVGLAVEDHDH